MLPFKQFSALAGGFALGLMMIPIIARTTEELLLLVPGTMREGALALGATRARAVFSVVLPAALPGIVTGVVLALARIAGETAPLLFTAFNNRFFSTSLRQPISSLTVQVYTYATGPYEDWHRQAWAGALVLVSIVLICSLLARLATRRLERMHARGWNRHLDSFRPAAGRVEPHTVCAQLSLRVPSIRARCWRAPPSCSASSCSSACRADADGADGSRPRRTRRAFQEHRLPAEEGDRRAGAAVIVAGCADGHSRPFALAAVPAAADRRRSAVAVPRRLPPPLRAPPSALLA